jgi:hypothetical protein
MHTRPLALLFLAALAAAACSSDTTSTDRGPGGGGADAATDAGTGDSAVADAMPVDTGPAPCVRDQDCDSGEVCNVKTGVCGAGVACMSNAECEACSRFNNPTDCGHGYHINAYCDLDRGNVCTRSLSPCEPCATDEDCGPMHPSISSVTGPQKCVDYPSGGKFCARSSQLIGCPFGFEPNAEGLCIRSGGAGCPTGEDFVVCPEKPAGGPNCTFEQTCPGEACAGVAGALCSTNLNAPGALGICIGACDDDADCMDPAFPSCNEESGICVPSCTKGGCADNKACHSDGFCADKCTDDAFCEMTYGANTYCNLPGRPAPKQFKGYRDTNSCAPLGCEDAVDCPAPGEVCDKTQAPPACVPGCFTTDDCRSGEVCKTPGAGGPMMTYSRAECRALAPKTDDTQLGVCCYPGCTDRSLGCPGTLDWCCGEEDSPYEDPVACGNLRDPVTMQFRRAEAGECFEMAPKPRSPFCSICDDMTPCESDDYDGGGTNWTWGYNTDPLINGGAPFKEQEFCIPVADGLNMCSVSCNPNAADDACPGRFRCGPLFVQCLQDADCNGLTCDGENTAVDPPVRGRCLCGENNASFAMCPNQYSGVGDVTNPRCVAQGVDGKMFCLMSYQCVPPPVRESPPMSGMYNYPAACLP